MDLSNGGEREAVGKLAKRLLSRDPVEINATINSSFTPDAVYRGHGLDIRGASNLKHAAWFWNALDAGKAATFAPSDVVWDEQKQTAVIQTRRFFRLRVFPLLGFSLNVPVRLHVKTSGSTSYVSRYEEIWLAERLLSSVPLVQAVHEAFFKSVLTLFVLTLSNVAFAAFARVRTLEPVSRAKKSLPDDVARGIDRGFAEGSDLAQGWGTAVVDVATKLAYPPLRIVEAGLQWATELAQGILPVDLPYPYIYDSHATPSRANRKAVGEKPRASPIGQKQASAPSKNNDLPSNDNGDGETVSAHVRVAPSLHGNDQGKTTSIASRIATEEEDKPAPAAKSSGLSLFDQMRKDGQNPIAEAAQDEAKAAEAAVSNGAQSSADDDGGVAGTHKSTKKKTNKKKKHANGQGNANGNNEAVHAPPPSFKEGLANAESNEA